MWSSLVLISIALLCASPVCSRVVDLRGIENLASGAQVSASSAAGLPGNKYAPADLVDNDLSTWWASAANAPLPQWFEITLKVPREADTIVLINSSNTTLYPNWKRLVIELSDGTRLVHEHPDTSDAVIVRFASREISSFKVTIEETHGQKVYVGCAAAILLADPDKRVRAHRSPELQWKDIDLGETPRPVHPCVYFTSYDVQRARERIAKEPWARQYADSVIAQADAALELSEEWLRQMMPERGAAFAYGFTGCPICGASWGTWGGARCSWDNPGHVTCLNGHVLPDEDHPDPGTGYVAPDGRIHYFVGSWNAWVTERFIHNFAGNLTRAYTLTGDERYAAQAALILDLIADIYPYCDKGSWDYPSNPPSGRLARPWYQVSRVLVRLVEFYDEIYHSPSLDVPSVTDGLTRRENIEQNMIKNGGWYCYEESLKGGLHNGEADYLRGVLAVGCLLGIESYVEWAYSGPYGILALVGNNVDRDGRYFETSVGYANHTRSLYLTFAEPLFNYRSEKYPDGVNLYDDTRFRSFYVLPELTLDCVGHSPRFGDSGPDTRRAMPPSQPESATDLLFAERLFSRSSEPARATFGNLVHFLSGGEITAKRAGSSDKPWLVFHAAQPPAESAGLPAHLERAVFASHFFGQKGIALLRAPAGAYSQAALIRFGPSLNHGHYDDLNLNYYALGYELTYDLGYSLGSTHTQVGWAKQTASHNLVMVNETTQGLSGPQDGSGGSLYHFADLPGLQLADCSAESVYASLGVDEYRRMTALVGTGPETYLFDVFRVSGGEQHDYIMHALSEDVDFAGVSLGEPQPGSLAGPDIRWGELQGNDGDMIGFSGKPYWNPPPGNGLGFLMHPRRGPATGPLTATWKLPEDLHLRMTLLPEAPTELVTAWAPGLYPAERGAYNAPSGFPRSRYVYARRAGEPGLKSVFAAVLEPFAPPAVEGMIGGGALLGRAESDSGSVRHLPAIGVVLFQGNSAEDELRISLSVPAAGRYHLQVRHYLSHAYGRAQVSLNGQALQPLLEGRHSGVEPGPLVDLGVFDLPAGEHVMGLRVVEENEGRFWIGLQEAGLVPEASVRAGQTAAAPFITDTRRHDLPGDALGVEVHLADGRSDSIVYRPAPGAHVEMPAGDGTLTTDAAFARIRHNDDDIEGMWLVRGALLTSGGWETRLPCAHYSGIVEAVDYAACRLVTTAELPDDGRLNGLPIHISNPGYSRNTVYRITNIVREGDRTIIDLGETSLVLGFGILDDEPFSDTQLTLLTQHEYTRALARPDSGFFHGKLMASEDFSRQTTIRATRMQGQLFQLNVDSTQGLRQGDRVLYYDIREGDTFEIHNTLALVGETEGTMRLQATDDVRLRTPQPLEFFTGAAWQALDDTFIAWRPDGLLLRRAR